MEKFTGENILSFADKFKTDKDCLDYLAAIKWRNGFVCSCCGHTKHTIRKKNLARDCNRCHHIESPTANTLFHKVKFGIRKAFTIVFEMSATTRGISARHMSKRLEISYQASWSFMHKVRIAMKSSESYPMTGTVQVDEFVYGGKEDLKQGRSSDSKKKKIVVAVETNNNGGVKRVYFKKIEDYSSSSLETIFEAHISTKAKINTDKWSGYKPLKKMYNISQEKSDKSNTLKELHTIIHQVKSWLRSVYSWMDKGHIEKYLDEFSFRINRSISKQTIFDNLIHRMIDSDIIDYKQIKLSN